MPGYTDPRQQQGIGLFGPSVVDQAMANSNRVRDVATRQGWKAAMHDPVAGELGANLAGQFDFTSPLGIGLPGAAVGIFAGARAKTADLGKLKMAKAFEKGGVSPKAVWEQTGWFKSPDGQWRFEIDDSKAQFARPFEESDPGHFYAPAGEARDVLSHPDLYAAYPGIGDVVMPYTVYGPNFPMRGSHKSAVPETDKYFGRSPEITLEAPTREELHGVGMHELQHNVQGIERFARGGSPSDFANMSTKLENEYVHTNNAISKLYQALAEGRDSVLIRKPGAENSEVVTGGPEKLRALLGQLEKRLGEIEPEYMTQQPFERYRRLGGEAEARAVQARAGMTPAQRRATFPLDSYDVPIDQLTMRGVGLGD